MPYKSRAQQGYFHAAKVRGEISPSVVKEFDKASKGLKLPKKLKKRNSRADREKAYRAKGFKTE